MINDLHCPMIHGGLQIDLKRSHTQVYANQCCLRNDVNVITDNVWDNSHMIPLRQLNSQNIWNVGCWTCQGNELAGIESLRTGMLKKFGVKTNLSGPQRLDLMFDIGCNLACRTCGPGLSTYWQRHLKQHNEAFSAPKPESRVDDMIDILKTLDLSNLEMVVFCGGETLLGSGYWQVAETIAKLADPKKITLSFQTNGTQPIDEQYYKIIEQFQLIQLNISLDGVGNRFEYLRWPAEWKQVTENILNLSATLPVNCMFLIEETISIFNLYYYNELDTWVKENFSTNRLGDIVNHTRHIATGTFSINNLSKEYVDALSPQHKQLISPQWKEHPDLIRKMISEIEKFDTFRNQNWKETFPEVSEFYRKFATSGM